MREPLEVVCPACLAPAGTACADGARRERVPHPERQMRARETHPGGLAGQARALAVALHLGERSLEEALPEVVHLLREVGQTELLDGEGGGERGGRPLGLRRSIQLAVADPAGAEDRILRAYLSHWLRLYRLLDTDQRRHPQGPCPCGRTREEVLPDLWICTDPDSPHVWTRTAAVTERVARETVQRFAYLRERIRAEVRALQEEIAAGAAELTSPAPAEFQFQARRHYVIVLEPGRVPRLLRPAQETPEATTAVLRELRAAHPEAEAVVAHLTYSDELWVDSAREWLAIAEAAREGR